jgi:hypothetical protein
LMSYFGMLLTLQSRGLQFTECVDHISHIFPNNGYTIENQQGDVVDPSISLYF